MKVAGCRALCTHYVHYVRQCL